MSRRVVLYTRVSTQEQGDRGYSLRDQEARLRAHADREGWEVVEHYQDDASAKTFERPSWRRLLAEVERAGARVDAVIVVKWDRFSRDATGALSMIRRLEARGVVVEAADQPLDASVPENLLMLAFYVAAPEVENRRRSLNVKSGMRRAMLEGRYVGRPPKGYKRGLDADGRFLIVPGPDAGHVVEAFALAADTDLPLAEIARRLRGVGWRCSKNQLGVLLRNPLYVGLIPVPAGAGDPAQLVAGRHEPLVDRATFDRAGERWSRPSPTAGRRLVLVPELPLRGHLMCPHTGRRLSGSASRGRRGGRVWYYHGIGRGAYRLPAQRMHERFDALLEEVRIPHEVAVLWHKIADEDAHQARAARGRAIAAARDRVAAAEARAALLDERFLDGDFDRTSYRPLRDKLRAELATERTALARAQESTSAARDQLLYAVSLMLDLPALWREISPEGRHTLLGSIFPGGLIPDEDGGFRTLQPSPVIGLFAPEWPETQDGDPVSETAVLLGMPDRIRTCGLQLRRLTLYPAELRARRGKITGWCAGG